jgi:VanW like protein
MLITHPALRRAGPSRTSLAIMAAAAIVCVAASMSVSRTVPRTEAPVVAPALAAVPAVSPSASMSASLPLSGGITSLKRATSPSTFASIPTATGNPSLEPDLVLLGTWTVVYEVGRANGDGANIQIPLRRLDGLVIRPGATFDFWKAVGEVSRRTGYRKGAIIVGNHIDPDGALAGGICTVSTVMFDAAARAGLQIVSRRSHGGYLAKYPLGLDAAVAKGDSFTQTMAFRNDTSESIVVRTVSAPGIARVDLYGEAALGRTVEFSQPKVGHRTRAHDRHVKTGSLQAGERRRLADASDGMTVLVTRTVRDADGHLLRRDRWVSVYRRLDGLVLDGTG